MASLELERVLRNHSCFGKRAQPGDLLCSVSFSRVYYFLDVASSSFWLSRRMDDHNLARLIAETPSRCILLLEDIDCAFPSRDDVDDDEPELDPYGQPINQYEASSTVTLSGLLNVLDSVTSEEGRITFATVSSKYFACVKATDRCLMTIYRQITLRGWIQRWFVRVVWMWRSNTS